MQPVAIIYVGYRGHTRCLIDDHTYNVHIGIWLICTTVACVKLLTSQIK